MVAVAVLVVEQLQVMMQVVECFMAGHKAARAAVAVGRLAPIFAGSVEDPETPLGLDSLDSLFAGQPTASGQLVTEEKSLGISTVWRAVNLIACCVASLLTGARPRISCLRLDAPKQLRTQSL